MMLRVSLPFYYQQRVTNAEEAFFDLNVGVEELQAGNTASMFWVQVFVQAEGARW